MNVTERAIREAYHQALASLVRLVGNSDEAEDALHHAVERALVRWADGIPERPVAWLITTARNAFYDRMRRQRTEAAFAKDARWLAQQTTKEVELTAHQLQDDMLRLIFTCCHPAISVDSQIALTLRIVVGLDVKTIARAYLANERAMEQRLTRARASLKKAAPPYALPSEAELPDRLAAVCAVIYLIFNDGYSCHSSSPTLRPHLCELAIRLGRLVARSFRKNAEVSGLLALMLLQHAHYPARSVTPGRMVSLDKQDRSFWDARLILEGKTIIERALRRRSLGPYQIQAAIAAVHASASTFAETDWQQIIHLYDVLIRYKPTTVVRVNRAVALFHAQGAEAGLEALDALVLTPALDQYVVYHAARGYMLSRSQQLKMAVAAYRRAWAVSDSELERAELSEQLEALGAAP